ncbi:hypothetical protein LTR28_001201 [Elasticomyces elasticus]|nr:hypothetical protein LTR28_001201 [Elasticomyces elasticus]
MFVHGDGDGNGKGDYDTQCWLKDAQGFGTGYWALWAAVPCRAMVWVLGTTHEPDGRWQKGALIVHADTQIHITRCTPKERLGNEDSIANSQQVEDSRS